MTSAWLSDSSKNSGITCCSKNSGSNRKVRKTAAWSRRPATTDLSSSERTAVGGFSAIAALYLHRNSPKGIDEVRVDSQRRQLGFGRQLSSALFEESHVQLAVSNFDPWRGTAPRHHHCSVLLD